MRLCTLTGARPKFIKIAPIVDAIEASLDCQSMNYKGSDLIQKPTGDC